MVPTYRLRGGGREIGREGGRARCEGSGDGMEVKNERHLHEAKPLRPSVPPSVPPSLRAEGDVSVEVALAPIFRMPDVPRGDVGDHDNLLPSLLRGLELGFDPVLEREEEERIEGGKERWRMGCVSERSQEKTKHQQQQ